MSFFYVLFQTSLLVFNTFYFIIGIGSIICAILFNLNSTPLIEFIKDIYKREYKAFDFGLIFYGFSLLITGLLACYGILKKSRFVLVFYFFLLFLIFIFQFTCCLYIFFQSNSFFEFFSSKLYEKMMKEYSTKKFYAYSIDYIQKTYQCCGVKEPQDWIQSNYMSSSYKSEEALASKNFVSNSNLSFIYKIPQSCCINEFENNCVLSVDKYYEIGCELLLREKFEKNKSYIIFTLSLLTILQLILLLLALYLCISVISNDRLTQLNKSATSSSSSMTYNDGSISVSELSLPEQGKFQAVRKNIFFNNYNNEDCNAVSSKARVSNVYDNQAPYATSKYL